MKRKYPKRIPVSEQTYRELLKRGRFHETWDDVIKRLLDGRKK